VAREVGVEGAASAVQANVPGAPGRHLEGTSPANVKPARPRNLTTQVRAIAEVADRRDQGADLTRLDFRAEAARRGSPSLKDNINTMIDKPGGSPPTRNTEQDWLKDQPRQVHQHAAGPSATSGTVWPAAAHRA